LNRNLFLVSIFEIRISFFAVLASWRDEEKIGDGFLSAVEIAVLTMNQVCLQNLVADAQQCNPTIIPDLSRVCLHSNPVTVKNIDRTWNVYTPGDPIGIVVESEVGLSFTIMVTSKGPSEGQ